MPTFSYEIGEIIIYPLFLVSMVQKFDDSEDVSITKSIFVVKLFIKNIWLFFCIYTHKINNWTNAAV